MKLPSGSGFAAANGLIPQLETLKILSQTPKTSIDSHCIHAIAITGNYLR
ncbi:hypothetical protein QUB05_16470 [Microcoleus sp. F10-C6]